MPTYVVIEIADEFQVFVGALPIDDAVSLLCHEKTEGETQVGLQQSLSQTVGRLFGVANLAEVRSLCTQGNGEILGTIISLNSSWYCRCHISTGKSYRVCGEKHV